MTDLEALQRLITADARNVGTVHSLNSFLHVLADCVARYALAYRSGDSVTTRMAHDNLISAADIYKTWNP